MKKRKRIIFLVNGYGLGNSTRVHGIIQHLTNDYTVDIFADGNSLKYFRTISGIEKIFAGKSLKYSMDGGKIRPWSTVVEIPKLIYTMYQNSKRLKDIFASFNYDLIITDSYYLPFLAIFQRKIKRKIMAINNSNKIVRKFFSVKKRNCLFQCLVEIMDLIYHRISCKRVISPFFTTTSSSKKFYSVPLIVRQEFLSNSVNSFSPHILIIMSGAGSLPTKRINLQNIYTVTVVERGNTFNVKHLMEQASIVIINGGLSSISEAIAMIRPMIIIPIEGHFEQRVNANWIEKNNLGVVASWDTLDSAVKKIEKDYSKWQKNIIAYGRPKGAYMASKIIAREIMQ